MSDVIIIAEAGVNHNGKLEIAKDLIEMAAESGADYVKFQTFSAKALASQSAGLAKYQRDNTGWLSTGQKTMLTALELSAPDHLKLIEYAKSFGIGFLSSPFDEGSLKFLVQLGLDYIKIPSGEIVNYPFLKTLATLNQNIILSTGMCDLHEVTAALDCLKDHGQNLEKVSLLQCTSQYPAPFDQLNLRVIHQYSTIFRCPVGLSDHSLGIEASIAAVALGATIIEKHVTLDKEMIGPDHAASLEPREFKQMIEAIRNISLALGDGHKRLMPAEVDTVRIARKSIVASEPIVPGDLFSAKNLTTKRPGTGLPAKMWDQIIGTRARNHYEVDDLISELEISANEY